MTAPASDSPRRSALAQSRSRRSREALLDAALRLWAAAESPAEIESVTVEQIAATAGLTRRSFYVHFAGKTDVLLALNADTDTAMAEAARATVRAGGTVDQALERAVAVLAEHSRRWPRALAAQILAEYHRDPAAMRETSEFRRQLPALFRAAKRRGELPPGARPEQLAALTAAVFQSATQAWAEGRSRRLRDNLDYGLEVLLAGARTANRSS